jgi:hypothetical protein
VKKILGIVLCLVCVSANAATFRYTYTGNSFITYDYCDGINACPTELSRISGYFDVSSELAADTFYPGTLAMEGFSFTDGLSVSTDSSIDHLLNFEIQTDSSGDIDSWFMIFAAAGGQGTLLDAGDWMTMWSTWGRPQFANQDVTRYCGYDACAGVSLITNGVQPGTWTMTAVPIPAAAWLFGSALGLLGWMRRKPA